MYNNAIEILNILSVKGFEAYIVGGYPRDKYLGIKSKDIDICTNATPTDISSIFNNVDMSNSSYGSVRIIYNDFSYEITTFRRDKAKLDGNRSYSIEYVDSLEEDLFRRDFIMNTLCIDKNGNFIDLLGAINDIDDRIIQTVNESSVSFKEDPLRILRAIRFSTVLSFSLSNEICSAFYSTNSFISKLSFYRIKKELDLIFSNANCMVGISCLKDFGIDKKLLLNFNNISYCSNYLGIWAQITFDDNYPFTKKELDIIQKIKIVLSLEPSFFVLYEYGIDICKLVDEIRKDRVYSEMNYDIPIHNREQIDINKDFLLDNVPFNLISVIYKKIENKILSGNLENKRASIEKYILEISNKLN